MLPKYRGPIGFELSNTHATDWLVSPRLCAGGVANHIAGIELWDEM